MRIGVNGRFLRAPLTGVQRFGRELLSRLASRAEVTLLVPRDAVVPDDLASGRVVRGRLAGVLWEQVELPLAARRARVPVLLCPCNAAPLLGDRNVVVLHDLIPYARPEDFSLRYRAWVRVGHVAPARRAAAVVTVSWSSARAIAEVLGRVPSEIAVVRQGVGPFATPASPAAVEQALDRLGVTRPYFVAVAGDDPRKQARFLDEVWETVPERARPPQLVVVGGGGAHVHRGAPRPQEARHPAVLRLGRVSDPDLAALYTGSVAVLHPARDEGFGRPPLEAMACGTRAVAAPYGPARETLGTFADIVPLEVAAWASAIGRLLEEAPEVRARHVEEGRRHASGFTWEETVDGMLAVCRAAAGTP